MMLLGKRQKVDGFVANPLYRSGTGGEVVAYGAKMVAFFRSSCRYPMDNGTYQPKSNVSRPRQSSAHICEKE